MLLFENEPLMHILEYTQEKKMIIVSMLFIEGTIIKAMKITGIKGV